MKLLRTFKARRIGTALIVTLAFLVIITILVVGFVASMRTERLAASSMAANEQTKQVALSALSHAISLLASNIPDPADPTIQTPSGISTNWYTNPGRLTLIDSAVPPNTNTIPLHSGIVPSANPLLGANLNAASLNTGKYPITGADNPMWVAWRNILQDDSKPPSATNKLVGRYAFWIDDEATKINVNVARGKPASMALALKLSSTWASSVPRDLLPQMANTFMIGTKEYQVTHPAAVNLDTVGLTASTLESLISTNGFFQYPDAIKPYFASDSAYEAEKFNLTVFGRSPEFNVFGKSRIFFTRWASSTETGPAYQHSYHPEQPTTFYAYTMGLSSSPNPSDPLYPQKIREVQEPVISSVARTLQRDDWPGMGGMRFRWAADPLGDEESDQIAININSMVSSSLRGSPGANAGWIVNDVTRRTGIEGDFTYSSTDAKPRTHSVWKGPNSDKGMLGLQQFPLLSEMGVRLTPFSTSGSTWKLQVEILQEVYLPPGYYRNSTGNVWVGTGVGASPDYKSASVVPFVQVTVTSGTMQRTNTTADVPSSVRWRFESLQSNGVGLDNYYTVALPRMLGSGATFVSSNTTTSASGVAVFPKSGAFTINVKLRAGLGTYAGQHPAQIAPFPIPASQSPDQPLDPALAASPDSDGYLEFDFAIDGTLVDSMITDPTLRPQKTYEIDDPRTYYRKSSWKPMSGDTLGFANDVSTVDDSKLSKFGLWNLDGGSDSAGAIGMLSLIPTGMQRGIAWDTMQFHSYNSGTHLPDWLVLDLVAPYYGYPISQRNSTAGKININSRIYPDNSTAFTPPERTKPLQALFANMPNGAQAATAVSDWQTTDKGFDYIGRITEVAGVADNNQGALDFDKEVILRNLAGMMTTQSNVFGIWGVAQTIKKSPNSTDYGAFQNGDTVTGEKRFYAVVERYVWAGKDETPGNATVDPAGYYSTLASGVDTATSPGMPPTAGYTPTKGIFSGSVKTSDSSYKWPPIDGPQAPQLLPTHGSATYTETSAESANNPLAAFMKYRIIYFTYLD